MCVLTELCKRRASIQRSRLVLVLKVHAHLVAARHVGGAFLTSVQARVGVVVMLVKHEDSVWDVMQRPRIICLLCGADRFPVVRARQVNPGTSTNPTAASLHDCDYDHLKTLFASDVCDCIPIFTSRRGARPIHDKRVYHVTMRLQHELLPEEHMKNCGIHYDRLVARLVLWNPRSQFTQSFSFRKAVAPLTNTSCRSWHLCTRTG